MNKGAAPSILVVLILLAVAVIAEAQKQARIPRIGILAAPSVTFFSARVEAFRERLRELGYVEGKNVLIESRYAEGKLERLPNLAAELVRLKVDVIVTASGPALQAAKQVSGTIPIVFAAIADPVGSGYVSSLTRPGGHVTGLSTMAPDLDSKRLELFKETFSKVSRIAFLWQSSGSRGNLPLTEMEATAKELRIKLHSLEVRSLDDFEAAFARAKKDPSQALITAAGPLINSQQRHILDFTTKTRLPAMYHTSEFAEAGGLMSYAPNYMDLFRRAADYVDKILKGTKPADLPVEQPMNLEFVINLKTAKQLGLTIPQWTLTKADRVIN